MKRKHWFSGLLVFTMMVILFTGCSIGNRHGLNPKDPVEITVWHYYNGAQAIAFDELITEFNNTAGAEEGIIVKAVSKSSIEDLVSAVTASAEKKVGAQELPHIFQCYLDTAVTLDNMDLLADLSPYITEEEKDTYVQNYIEEGILGGKNGLKLFPVAKSTEVLVLNVTDWEPFSKESGITEEDLSSWEGINKTAEKYYAYSGGKSFFGRDSFANYMLIGSLQLGEEIFQVDKGTVTLNLDEAVMRKLWDNYYIPYIKGYYNHTGRFRTDDIKIGKIIAAVGASTGTGYLPESVTDAKGNSHPVDYKILPVPGFSDTESIAVQQGASMAVTKTSDTEEYASTEFLKWFTRPEHNIGFALESGYLPVKKEANDMKKIEEYLKENNISKSVLEKSTLEVSIQQLNNSRLYTTKGFQEGYDARAVLNTSMIDLAIADREAILSKAAEGINEAEAQQPYLTDEYFAKWFHNLKQQLEEICSGN